MCKLYKNCFNSAGNDEDISKTSNEIVGRVYKCSSNYTALEHQ